MGGFSWRRRKREAGGNLCRCFPGLCAVLFGVPARAEAFELSGGVNLGAVLIGTDPRVAVSPQAGISWRMDSAFLISVRDLLSFLPATDRIGVGVYNHISIDIGYDSKKGNVSIGPSISIYSVPACGAVLCGRVVGLSPGGHAQVSVYITESFGMAASANVDWIAEEPCPSRQCGCNGDRRAPAAMEVNMNIEEFRWWIATICIWGLTACNYTEGECYLRGEGGWNGGVGVGGAGGVSPNGGGGFGDVPPEPQDAADQRQLECNADELGGVTCIGPVQCSQVCSAASKFCVEYAMHPYKSGLQPGELYDCIDSIPPARLGGSYTCLYRYENGDACVFSYAAKFGPIHPPAPKPLCVYKSK